MYSSATGANFEAVDRVVKIVRELDRYHGFAAVPRPREAAGTRLPLPPAESPIATPKTWPEPGRRSNWRRNRLKRLNSESLSARGAIPSAARSSPRALQ